MLFKQNCFSKYPFNRNFLYKEITFTDYMSSSATQRLTIPAIEEILGQEIQCLDKGFIRLIDYMGGDQRVVQAARVSYGDQTSPKSKDADLIDYLYRNEHTSPFEHVITAWHIKLPIFIARHWVRHRTARINEISGRYSIMKDEFYIPPQDEIRTQSGDNKQARGEELDVETQKKVLEILKGDQTSDYASYQELLQSGLAKELARINLPLSLYTQWYWNIDLHNLFHFFKLRLHPHAQQEIRAYAEKMMEVVDKLAPLSTNAFRKYELNSMRLSSLDIEGINKVIRGESPEAVAASLFTSKSETREFIEKVGRFQ